MYMYVSWLAQNHKFLILMSVSHRWLQVEVQGYIGITNARNVVG